jgi:hypothetical protein
VTSVWPPAIVRSIAGVAALYASLHTWVMSTPLASPHPRASASSSTSAAFTLSVAATVVSGVHVVDVVTGRITRDQAIVVEGGVITRIVPAASLSMPDGATVHRAQGAYVIPGLWDTHVHLGLMGRSAVGLFLANGITGVRDMGSDRVQLGAWADSLDAGTLQGPHVVWATAGIEGAMSGARAFERSFLSPNAVAEPAVLPGIATRHRSSLPPEAGADRHVITPATVAIRGYRLMGSEYATRVLADTGAARDPRVRYLDWSLHRAWQDAFAHRDAEPSSVAWSDTLARWLRELRPMVDAGVVLLAGSDAGTPLAFPGFSLADELEMMVKEGGLTPLQSLQSATINVARWANTDDRSGSVAVGRAADLVLLDRNPLEKIGNVRRVQGVMRSGRMFDRAAIDSMLEDARRRI